MRKISAWWIVLTFFVLTVASWALNELPNLVVDQMTINANIVAASSTLTETVTGNFTQSATGTMSQTVTGPYAIATESSMGVRVGGILSQVVVSSLSTQVYGNQVSEVRGNLVPTTVGTMSAQIYGNHNRSVVGTMIDAVTGAITRTFSGGETTTITGNKAQTISGNYSRITTGTTSLNTGSNYNQVVAGSMSTTVSGNIDLYGRIVTASFNGAVTIKPEGDLSILSGSSGDVILSGDLAVGASTAPRGSAIAEFISGGAKALGLPVLTSAEQTALVNPLMGMLAYIRSTSLLEYYNGTSWTQIDTASNVPTITDWVAYTPTFTASTNISTVGVYWRRVGDTMYIRGGWSYAGTGAGTPFAFSIPDGYTIKDGIGYTSLSKRGAYMGVAYFYDTGVPQFTTRACAWISTTSLGLLRQDTGAYADGGDMVINEFQTLDCQVPISGWTCCN